MVPVERIELPTFGLQNHCSTSELNRLCLFRDFGYGFCVSRPAFQQVNPALYFGPHLVLLSFVHEFSELFDTETDDLDLATSGVARFFTL
jgi:hypothetical protein